MDGQNLLPVLLVPAALLVAAGAFVAWRLEDRRRDAIGQAAARLGLSFAPERNAALARQYEHLRGLHDGANRYAFDVLHGDYEALPVTLFDFHHETHSTDSQGVSQTQHHYHHVALLHLPREFPDLLIGPEGIFSKIAQAVGYDDIDFESHEFSRRFCVRSHDKRFAYDFCNSAMIEFLLANPSLRLEIQAGLLALVFPGRLPPAEIGTKLALLPAIRERMPAYLFAA